MLLFLPRVLGGAAPVVDDARVVGVDPWTTLGSLAVVGGLLWALPGVLRRLQQRQLSGGRRIQVVEIRPLSARRSLILVKVGPETMLLGSSEAGLHSLGTIESALDTASAPVDLEPAVETASPATEGSPFLRCLEQERRAQP